MVEATIEVIHRKGYDAASTALIAARAGVSRGAILHHFGTRAALMAQVVDTVFQREWRQYGALLALGEVGHRVWDWPTILWNVLSQPSGLAVLDILQAANSDPELAKDVRATQISVEAFAIQGMRAGLGGTEQEALTVMRLMVWAVRGLSMADRFMPNPAATRSAVDLLSRMLRIAAPAGQIPELTANFEDEL
ncbi:helix-turn-helix domain-containing protein [Sphingomonas sp. RB3P16]|uniref:TetR/AcrR family transcriptional regulator n=1 Tax=Parasphingomonas frigoris TaxID=3096163 RepID=UPI002FC8C11F